MYKIVRHLPDRDAAALVMSSLKAKQRVSNKDLEKAEQKLIDAVIKHLAEMSSMLKPTQYEVAVCGLAVSSLLKLASVLAVT